MQRFLAGLVLCVPVTVPAAPGQPIDGYDEQLCVTAQRLLINGPDMPVRVQSGVGNGFHTIQMNVDEERRQVVVAMTTVTVTTDAGPLATHVACKMVDRDRVNDILGLALDGTMRSCRDVNAHTYGTALASLTDAERNRYLGQGRPLVFGDDAVVATGGEWLPAAIDAFISPAADGQSLEVRAPTVRVPWNAEERGFFQGTCHCKLITLAAMQRWMRVGAFEAANSSLFPREQSDCTAPVAPAATAGSCRFWFAPAQAMFCQDYSGHGWTETAARQECGKRHASPEALRLAGNRYEGAGGLFSEAGCTDRSDVPEISGTCVFHCNDPDETLWRVTGTPGPMMNKACDLYLPATASE